MGLFRHFNRYLYGLAIPSATKERPRKIARKSRAKAARQVKRSVAKGARRKNGSPLHSLKRGDSVVILYKDMPKRGDGTPRPYATAISARKRFSYKTYCDLSGMDIGRIYTRLV